MRLDLRLGPLQFVARRPCVDQTLQFVIDDGRDVARRTSRGDRCHQQEHTAQLA